MISRLKIQGYKSLVDVEVELAPLTVVFGANAAGKSNLLDAVNLLARMVTSENLEEAFAEHRGSPLEAFTFAVGGMSELLGRGTARFTMEVDVELARDVERRVKEEIAKAREGLTEARPRSLVLNRRLRYRITIEILTDSGHLRVMDERLEPLKADGTPDAGRKPFIGREGREQRIRLRREGQAHPIYEDLGQDRPIVSKRLYAPHYPHAYAFREELARWRTYFLEPSAMRAETPLKEVQVLPATGADLAAFYNTLRANNRKQFGAFERTLRLAIATAQGLQVEPDKSGLLRLEVREAGIPMSARVVSEGTLRILGLLAITNPLEELSVVGYEEPENGVHADRLSMVGRVLLAAAERGTTQYLVNTHSPVLPEYFIGQAPARIIRCSKSGRETRFEALDHDLFTEQGIGEALVDHIPSSFGQRLVRGDFR